MTCTRATVSGEALPDQLAVFIYGLPGAGKTTVLSIADAYDVPSVVMGDVVREKAEEDLGPEPTSDEIGQWATEQRKQHGSTIMAEYTKNRAESLNSEVVVIEGARSPDELAVFRSDSSFATGTIRIDALFADRLERLQDRGRDGEEDFTATDLIHRDAREFSWGLGELFATDTPDYQVANTESFAEYQSNMRKVFDDMLST